MANLKNTVINSTDDIQLPSGTTSERPISPSDGYMRFNTDMGVVEYYVNNGWSFLPDIVKDGLVLYLDAGNPDSYPGTGSTWFNLTGNSSYNATLNSVSIQNNYAEFNSQSDSISLASNLFISREKTLSMWIKTNRPLSTQDNWQVGFLDQGSTQGSMFGFMYGVGPTQDLGYWGYGGDYDLSVESPSNSWSNDANWHNAVITMNSSREVKGYIDGQEIIWSRNSDNALAYTYSMPIDTTNYFLISSRGVWNSGMTYVHLGHVLVYNKTLSLTEVQNNFYATRFRFGI